MIKHKLDKIFFLLDESMPPKKNLPRINKRSRFNIKHITQDYKRSGLPDDVVLRRAEKEGRILVTADKDFLKTQRIKNTTGIIKIIGGLTIKEVENIFCKIVGTFPNKHDYFGKIISASRDYMLLRSHFGKNIKKKYKQI